MSRARRVVDRVAARLPRRLRYGAARSQFVRWYPARAEGADRRPVVVLYHGGYWRWPYGEWVTTLVARDLARRGWHVLNAEYRRLGRFGGGGGSPRTFDDAAAAFDLLRRHAGDDDASPGHPATRRFLDAADPDRVALVGHSAGGHLALVVAGRAHRRGEAAGLTGVIAIGAPSDLERFAADGAPSVDELVADAPPAQRWSATSPIEMLPLGVRSALVHGADDETVAPRMSSAFVDAALARGDVAELELVPDEGHRAALRPSSATWTSVVRRLERWFDEAQEVAGTAET